MTESILSALIGISMLDSSIAGIKSTAKTKKLREEYYDLANQIAKDTSLANKLIEGYNEKGAKYAQELVGMSPFSTAFYKVQDAIKLNDKNIAEQRDVINRLQNQGQINLNNKMKEIEDAQSSSVIGDLLSGKTSLDNNFIGKQFSQIIPPKTDGTKTHIA